MVLFILKLLIVLVFLVAFLRHPRPFWGIGLLTVATAFLLDTFLNTFGWDTMQETMGFFFYVLAGALAGAAAVWFWSLLRPLVGRPEPARASTSPPVQPPPPAPRSDGRSTVAFDRRELYDQIRERLGTEDMRDLAFDLQMNENDVFSPGYSATESIVRLMDVAEARGRSGDLALAVERILTPIGAADLPRPEKLSAQSPPTVLRHYLLANLTLDELADLAGQLGIDWEQLGSGKRDVARNLLLYLQRRSRLDELIGALQAGEATEENEAKPAG
jgi:hypothetical protein